MAKPSAIDPNSYALDMGDAPVEALALGGTQPSEGAHTFRTGQLVLMKDGDKVFIEVPLTVAKSHGEIGDVDVGKERTERQYLPDPKRQEAKALRTTRKALVRWVCAFFPADKHAGVKKALLGEFDASGKQIAKPTWNVGKLIERLSNKTFDAWYVPYIDGTESHKNSELHPLLPGELEVALTGKLIRPKEVVKAKGRDGFTSRGGAADDALGGGDDGLDDLDGPTTATGTAGGAAGGAAPADDDDLFG